MSSLDPPSEPLKIPSIHPRKLIPIHPYPYPLSYPELPSPCRPANFSDTYSLTTHIVPAAYPRVVPDVSLTLPDLPDSITDKEERKRINAERTKNIRALREDYLQRGADCQPGSRKPLWNCVNRIVRKDLGGGRGKGLTLFFAHANGFHKEIWEPTIQHLLDGSPPQIDEIWVWEAVNHGDSALINEPNLSGIFDWMDNSRDILNFLINYVPSTPTSSILPVHLPRISSDEAGARQLTGFKNRNIIVVGHSFGGATSTLVAINCPALFSSLILVDPVITQPNAPSVIKLSIINLVTGAVQRRERWGSREEALRLFQQNSFFSSWHPSVLKIYTEHGITRIPPPEGGVKLKMSAIQEAICFDDIKTSEEVWEMIEGLDERIELRWVIPGKDGAGIHSIGGGTEAARVRVWRRPKNSSNTVIPNCGHLIPQEGPHELAEEIRRFIEEKYGVDNSKL